MGEDVWRQRCKQDVNERGMVIQAGFGEQDRDVQLPRTVRADAVAPFAGLGRKRDMAVELQQLDHGAVEGGEALSGRGAWS